MTTTGTDGSPIGWRYTGDQIKRWRERAGISREQLGNEAGYVYETVRSMEQGRRRPTHQLLEVADQMCDARGVLLAAEGYLQPERFASYSQEYMAYEAVAVALIWYESRYVPGLLQTEEYIRAALATLLPPLDEETLEERVKARLERQKLLEIRSRSFGFVIEEAVLRCRFGDDGAHAGQLRRLLEAAEQRNIAVQVMPAARGLHAGVRGPFVILETPEHEHLVYEEGQTGGLLYAEPEKVSTIMRRHEMIAREALSPGDSARFVTKLLEEQP